MPKFFLAWMWMLRQIWTLKSIVRIIDQGGTITYSISSKESRLGELDSVIFNPCHYFCMLNDYLEAWIVIIWFNFMFVEIFQILPGGPSKPPSDSMLFCVNLGFQRGTAERHELAARRCMCFNLVFEFLYESSSSGECPPSDTS